MTTTATKPNAAVLVELARKHATLFHSPDRVEWGVIFNETNTVGEVVPLRSRAFRNWLARTFHRDKRKPPGNRAIEDSLAVLCGYASEGDPRDVNIRTATRGGRIYIDLAQGENNQAVEIDSQGWRIIQSAPVYFFRPRGMLPLTTPADGDTRRSLTQLQGLLNCDEDDRFKLLLAWLVGALKPCGPYVHLVLTGEQGAGKSITTRILRTLIDPNVTQLRAAPRTLQDLAIAAGTNRVLAFDNVSKVDDWLSDSLCRLSTGGGFGTRQLYTDMEEVVIDAHRPAILNAVPEIVNRPDLLDRVIVLELPGMDEAARTTESILWQRFEALQPGITGALYTVVSYAMANLPTVKVDRPPRMADFAEWIEAAGIGLGFPAGKMVTLYRANMEDAEESLVANDPVYEAVKDFMTGLDEWDGTATQLLKALRNAKDFSNDRKYNLGIINERGLAATLRRLVPAFRKRGILITFRKGTKRKIFIDRCK